jgi:hypothetical protein
MLVAGGGNGSNKLAYSYNGINWIGLGTGIFSSYGKCVAWNGSMFVAVGSGSLNSIAYSYNGITWIGLGTSVFTGGGGNGVAWCGTKWVAVGFGTNNMAYSNDGINWIGLGGSSKPNIEGEKYCITWSGNKSSVNIQQPTIAFGEGINTIAYSIDGIYWSGLGSNIFSTVGMNAVWNGNIWVAVGKGTNSIAYSRDGLNWIGLGSDIFSIIVPIILKFRLQ